MKFNKSSIALAVALLSSAGAASALSISASMRPVAPVGLFPLAVTTQSSSAGSKNLFTLVSPAPAPLISFFDLRTVNFTIVPPLATVTVPTTTVLQVGDVIEVEVTGAKFDGVASAALSGGPITVHDVAIPAFPLPLPLPAASTVKMGPWTLNAAGTIFSSAVTTASPATGVGDPVTITVTPRYDITGASAGETVKLTSRVKRFSSSVIAHEIPATGSVPKELKLFPTVAVITTGTAGSATATVSESFLKFSGLTPTKITIPLLSGGGGVSVGDIRAGLSNTTGKLFVKLTGLPLNTEKVTWPGLATPANQVLADKSTTPTTVTPGSAFYLPGDGNGYALIGTAAAAAGLQDMEVTVDGVTAILPTSIKLEADYVAGSSDILKNHTILAPTTVSKIRRDGSSFTVNSSNKDNVIKITDMSGNIVAGTGDITIMAYDNAGAAVAGTYPIAPLVSGGTAKIAVKNLKTAYPGAVRYDFSIESSAVIASNVKRVKNAAGQTIGINVEKYSPNSVNTL